MGKTVFRMIRGRVVAIRLGSEKAGAEARRITAHVVDDAGKRGAQIGKMDLEIPKRGVSATIAHAKVEPKFQGHGISRSMFRHAQDIMGKIGKKFLRSDQIVHEAQIAVREHAGKSRFISTGLAGSGDKSKLVKAAGARDTIKSTARDHIVSGTTMIPKALRKKP